MATLADRLKRIKTSFLERAPTEAVAVMERATEELRASGILDRIPGVGDQLAAFELADSEGRRVESGALLRRGPLVLSFYRGFW